jgi:hypothetical protein
MPKFLLLLSCWFIASGSICQNPPAAFFDTPTITENSVGKARIGMTSAKLKEAYKGCLFTPTYLAKYGFDGGSGKPDAATVSRAGQKLFIYFLNGPAGKTSGFIVLNPAYKTAAGIHVGSTSGQLKAAVPAVRVGPHEFVENMQIASAGTEEHTGLQYIFQRGPMGKKPDSMEPSEIATPSAKVSWILIKPD